MGLFSAIGSFVGGVCSAVSNAFSSMGKVLSPIVQKVVGCISAVLQNSVLMQKLMPLLAIVIPPPWDAVAVVVVQVVCALCGKEENPEKLGYQMNSADKAPEDFGSFAEYREYLDREFPFDQNQFDQLSEEDKSACRLTGIVGAIQDVKEATGRDIDPNLIGAMTNLVKENLLTGEALKDFTIAFCAALSKNGLDPIQTITDYTKQAVAPDAFDKMMSSCEAALEKIKGEAPSAFEVMSTMSNPSCAENL